jgi:hypothetical protein
MYGYKNYNHTVVTRANRKSLPPGSEENPYPNQSKRRRQRCKIKHIYNSNSNIKENTLSSRTQTITPAPLPFLIHLKMPFFLPTFSSTTTGAAE